MEQYLNILVEIRGVIGIITINRPKALNALNTATLHELDAAISTLDRNDAVRVVIVTGSGEKAFVAGADIAEMQGMSATEARSFARLGQGVFHAHREVSASDDRCRQRLRARRRLRTRNGL